MNPKVWFTGLKLSVLTSFGLQLILSVPVVVIFIRYSSHLFVAVFLGHSMFRKAVPNDFRGFPKFITFRSYRQLQSVYLFIKMTDGKK